MIFIPIVPCQVRSLYDCFLYVQMSSIRGFYFQNNSPNPSSLIVEIIDFTVLVNKIIFYVGEIFFRKYG